MDADSRPFRTRRATRLVVVNRGRTLLFRDTDPGVPGSSWWTTPGGGLDPGEDWRAAGVRELREETGYDVDADQLLGPVAHRTVVHGYSDRVTEQEEMFFVVHVGDEDADHGISTAGHTPSERQRIVEHAWIARDDLAALTVWPREVSRLMDADPAELLELGRVEESTVPVPH